MTFDLPKAKADLQLATGQETYDYGNAAAAGRILGEHMREAIEEIIALRAELAKTQKALQEERANCLLGHPNDWRWRFENHIEDARTEEEAMKNFEKAKDRARETLIAEGFALPEAL